MFTSVRTAVQLDVWPNHVVRLWTFLIQTALGRGQVFLKSEWHRFCNLKRLVLFDRRRQWHPTPVLLPGKSHGWRSLEGSWGSMGSLRVGHDWATSLSLSCIGEGNGSPLQCSCLENHRDGGAVYGVTQSQTRLKRLSSSSPIWLTKSSIGNKYTLSRVPDKYLT